MTLHKGDMMSRLGTGEWVFVTTNSFITSRGSLVMGAGAAAALAAAKPGVPLLLATYIEHLEFYGVVWLPSLKVGAFQTKRHFQDPSDLPTITRSTAILAQWATLHPTYTINLNFPGIGFGKLQRPKVLPVVSTLPDNVHVWEHA